MLVGTNMRFPTSDKDLLARWRDIAGPLLYIASRGSGIAPPHSQRTVGARNGNETGRFAASKLDRAGTACHPALPPSPRSPGPPQVPRPSSRDRLGQEQAEELHRQGRNPFHEHRISSCRGSVQIAVGLLTHSRLQRTQFQLAPHATRIDQRELRTL